MSLIHHAEQFHHSTAVDMFRTNKCPTCVTCQALVHQQLLVLDRLLDPESQCFQVPHFPTPITGEMPLAAELSHGPALQAQLVHEHEPCRRILFQQTKERPYFKSAMYVSQVQPPKRSYILRVIGLPIQSVSVQVPTRLPMLCRPHRHTGPEAAKGHLTAHFSNASCLFVGQLVSLADPFATTCISRLSNAMHVHCPS